MEHLFPSKSVAFAPEKNKKGPNCLKRQRFWGKSFLRRFQITNRRDLAQTTLIKKMIWTMVYNFNTHTMVRSCFLGKLMRGRRWSIVIFARRKFEQKYGQIFARFQTRQKSGPLRHLSIDFCSGFLFTVTLTQCPAFV